MMHLLEEVRQNILSLLARSRGNAFNAMFSNKYHFTNINENVKYSMKHIYLSSAYSILIMPV